MGLELMRLAEVSERTGLSSTTIRGRGGHESSYRTARWARTGSTRPLTSRGCSWSSA